MEVMSSQTVLASTLFVSLCCLGPILARPQEESYSDVVLRSPRSLIDSENCGIPNERMATKTLSPTARIFNSTCAPYGSHPWTVQIQHKSGSIYYHQCGGTILSEDFILTAAHCLLHINKDELKVIVGQSHQNVHDPEEVEFEIEKAFIHPDWTLPTKRNDVALLKIQRKSDGSGIPSNDFISSACLPKEDMMSRQDAECTLSGWGQSSVESIYDETCMRYANIPLINDEECKKMYGNELYQGMMCAGFKSGGTDGCRGDSGGPLACKVDGRFYILGISSWGDGCGQAEKPGIYSNVHHYIDWIKDTINSA